MKTFCTKIIRYKMIGVIEIIWALHFLNIHKRLDAQPLIYTMLTCHYTCSYLVRFCSHILFSFFFLPLVLALCLFNVFNWLISHVSDVYISYHLLTVCVDPSFCPWHIQVTIQANNCNSSISSLWFFLGSILEDKLWNFDVIAWTSIFCSLGFFDCLKLL